VRQSATRLESPLFQNAPPDKLKGLVLGPGPAGRCDDAKLGIGVPRWNEKSRQWLLWYYCRDRDYPLPAPPTLGTGSIAMATSTDGLTWQRVTGPGRGGAILEASTDQVDFDSLHVGLTDVTIENDRYFMWTFGGNNELADSPFGQLPGLRMRPGLAVSADGLQWSRVRGPASGGAMADIPTAQLYCSWPNALHTDGKIYLYASVTDTKLSRWDTVVFVSSDGAQSWSAPQPLRWLDASPRYDGAGELTRSIMPNPLNTGHRWLMAYTALDGSPQRFQRRSHALAVSDDALSWWRLYGKPIFEIDDETAWDGGGVAAPQLRKVGHEWRLYYYGFPKHALDNQLPKGVGLAIATADDLSNFTRFSAD
jgi:predicted GH43/DUF377 family glycosyl hydrolase